MPSARSLAVNELEIQTILLQPVFVFLLERSEGRVAKASIPVMTFVMCTRQRTLAVEAPKGLAWLRSCRSPKSPAIRWKDCW